MAIIIGNTTATPNPRPDWNQTDATKADYIKNKPIRDVVLDDGKLDITNYDTGLYRFYSNTGAIIIQAYNGEGSWNGPLGNDVKDVYKHYINDIETDYLLAYIEKGRYVGETTTFVDMINNVKVFQNSQPEPDIMDLVYWYYDTESYLTHVINSNVGIRYAGCLMYIDAKGFLKPLNLGEGLKIENGTLMLDFTQENKTTSILGVAEMGTIELGNGG